MSNFPGGFDDDSTLPAVNDNLTEIGGDAINALRDAVFQIEQTLGLNVQGVTPNLAARLGVFINSDGTPNASVLTSLGLVTLPIRNDQIAENAGIPESKLHLDFRTQDLFNYIRDLSLDVNTALGWISVSGVKLEPHLIGAIYRHTMDQIDVSENTGTEPFLENVQRLLRNNLNSFTLATDMNNELLAHQWADGSGGSILGPPFNITTNNGSIYSSLFAHVASGIFLDSSRFSTIPQTRDNMQLFAEYIDTQSIFLLGTRIQNLYTNGISAVSTSSNLTTDGYGQFIVPPTPAIAYLENNGNILLPFDNINSGDDIVQFVPSLANQTSFAFDSQFSLVRAGDIIRVFYGDGYNIEVPYIVREKKYNPGSGPGTATYAIRIAGKNQAYSPHAIARIDRPLSNNNKFAELAISPVSNPGITGAEPSLIINNPRAAQALGNGLNLDELDENHYNLYLALYPTGSVSDGYFFLPAIDVTGNQGKTPGQYTLEGIVQATNNAFRAPGYNYRFTAFAYQGNFGICLADSYNNAAFSIISSVITPSGAIDTLTNSLKFPNNVLDLAPTTSTITTGSSFTFPATSINVASTAEFLTSGSATVTTTTGTTTFNYTGTTTTSFNPVTGGTGTVLVGSTVTQPLSGGVTIDPLGIGPVGAGIASPPFLFNYGSSAASVQPTKLFVPLRRNNYYVNGAEAERLAIPNTVTRLSTQAEDGYGDGYWIATVQANISPAGRVQKIYRVFQDLSVTNLAPGKTIVVQSATGNVKSEILDYGRFTIESVSFNCAPSTYTDITVYDAVHGNGSTGISGTIAAGSQVFLYFSDDSATFNKENSTDFATPTPSGQFKRYFEIYIDDNGSNFTQERGRITLAGANATVNGVTLYGFSQLNKLDIVTISPKLRGYQFGSVTKITLNMSYVSATGVYTGYLASYDGTNFTHVGPTTSGKLGETTRFYDETNTDYIEINFASTVTLADFTNQQIDFQLFPTLQLDTEVMLIGSCQVNDVTQGVSKIVDRRQFGNISEKDLSTSVFDYLSVPEKYLHANGVIRGFDIPTVNGILSGGSKGIINLSGGVALVNGKINRTNNETITVPIVKELYSGVNYPINWFFCLNDAGDYVLVPSLDFDSNLGTPNAPTRSFVAQDFVSSNTYSMSAVTFTDMINRRPDLTVLYIIQSTVTGVATSPIITLNVIDARRFSFKRDWGLAPTLNADAGNNGDFRSFNALGAWLIRNANYSNTVRIKGTFTTFPTILQFPATGSGVNLGGGSLLSVRLMGDGKAIFDSTSFGEFQAAFVEFNNMTIQNTATTGLQFSQCNLNSCTVNCAGSMGFLVTSGGPNNLINNTTFTFTGASSIVLFANTILNDCVININGASTTLYLNQCILNNCIININGSGTTVNFTSSTNIPNVMQGGTVNLNASGITFANNGGEINNNIFNWNTGANQPLNMNGNFFLLKGNQFYLLPGSSPSTMVSVLGGSNGIITGNDFVRGSVNLPINSITGLGGYIQGSVNSICAVVNNFFDANTCDGSNQTLVSVQQPAWVVQDNLNTPLVTNTVRVANTATYTVQFTDVVIVLDTTLQTTTINLPSTTNSPQGRTITIKDLTGALATHPVTFHRFSGTDYIEGVQADYVYAAPYGSITLIMTANAVGTNSGWMIL